jgi:hypothetical protein
MRRTLIALAIIATLAIAAVGSASDRALTEGTATSAAELQIRPSSGSSPRGVGLFRQTGATLRGWVVVWGLQPHTRHAVHFHGPRSACGAKADPVAAHQDLVADARGVAYATVRVRSPVQVLRKGIYYNVHALPTGPADNPEIACANIVPIP